MAAARRTVALARDSLRDRCHPPTPAKLPWEQLVLAHARAGRRDAAVRHLMAADGIHRQIHGPLVDAEMLTAAAAIALAQDDPRSASRTTRQAAPTSELERLRQVSGLGVESLAAGGG